MLNLDGVRICEVFLALALLCFLAQWAFWPLRDMVVPPGVVQTWDVASILGFNLILCIGILAVVMFLIPAAYGLVALGATLVGLGVSIRVYRRGRTGALGALALRQRLSERFLSVKKRPVPLALTLVSLGYFVWTLAYVRWPPPGDIMSLHGPLTLDLVSGGYAGVVARLGYFYPFGFHLFPAALAGPFSLYPAEAVFAFGGFIAALIPPMMYYVSERLGAPPPLAFLAFTAAFVAHPSDNMEKWILGPFFNGPYPNLTGYLVVLLIAVHLIDRFKDGISRTALVGYARPAVLYSSILAFIYPSFSALVLLHVGILFLAYGVMVPWRTQFSQTGRSSAIRLVRILGAGLLAACVIAVLLFSPLLSYIGQLYSSTPSGDMLAYQLDTSFFTDNLAGFVILAGIAVSVRDVLTRRRLGIATFYLMITSLLVASLNPWVYRIVWPILPSRSLLILATLAWPLVLVELHSEVQHLVARLRRPKSVSPEPIRLRRVRRAVPVTAIFIVVLAAQALAFPAVSALDAPAHYGWFSNSAYFSDDFGGVEWLVAHVAPTELTLSDGSYVSRYALSMGFFSLSNGPPLEYNHTLFDALNLVWADPGNVTYMAQVLKAHDVRFVFSTSEWGTLDREYTVQYIAKPHTPDVYAQLFDTYPFLHIVYQAGYTRVYRVLQTSL